MLKIILLEDEKPHADRLSGYLSRYGEEHPGFGYTLRTYQRGMDLLTDYGRDADLIFLDIRVPDMLGIDVARKLREVDDNVMIVFITSLSQYAIDGYSVDAFDYVLKPISYPVFAAKLSRALRALSYREPATVLELRTKEEWRRVPAGKILYVESSGHDLLFHTPEESIQQWGTLGKYEEQLRESHFARCSTSYLVNLKYVQCVRRDAVVVGGEELPISRSKRKEFLAALAQYKGGSL